MDGLTDPAKLKALAAYNAASDHFDDEPLAFWSRIGSRTVERLALPSGAMVLDVGCGSLGHQLSQRRWQWVPRVTSLASI